MNIWGWLKDLFNNIFRWCIKGYRSEALEECLEQNKHCDEHKNSCVRVKKDNGIEIDIHDHKVSLSSDKVQKEEEK